jgi:hypothetical protein
MSFYASKTIYQADFESRANNHYDPLNDANAAAAEASCKKVFSFRHDKFNYNSPASGEEVPTGDWQVCRIRTFIDLHLDKRIRVRDLREITQFSISHFTWLLNKFLVKLITVTSSDVVSIVPNVF